MGNGTIDTTNTTSYILSNLNPSSAYEFYVQAICGVGDSSVWAGPFSFSTNIQGPVGVSCTSGGAGIIYSDDLESQGGWTGDFGTGNGVWRTNSGGTASSGTGPLGAHSGSGYFYYETSTGGSPTGTIVSPVVDLTNSSGSAELSFFLHAFGPTTGTLDVGAKKIDPISGLVRVFVNVNAQILDCSDFFPIVVASIGPVQFSGQGPDATVAENNALLYASEEAAKQLVSQLSNKNIY